MGGLTTGGVTDESREAVGRQGDRRAKGPRNRRDGERGAGGRSPRRPVVREHGGRSRTYLSADQGKCIFRVAHQCGVPVAGKGDRGPEEGCARRICQGDSGGVPRRPVGRVDGGRTVTAVVRVAHQCGLAVARHGHRRPELRSPRRRGEVGHGSPRPAAVGVHGGRAGSRCSAERVADDRHRPARRRCDRRAEDARVGRLNEAGQLDPRVDEHGVRGTPVVDDDVDALTRGHQVRWEHLSRGIGDPQSRIGHVGKILVPAQRHRGRTVEDWRHVSRRRHGDDDGPVRSARAPVDGESLFETGGGLRVRHRELPVVISARRPADNLAVLGQGADLLTSEPRRDERPVRRVMGPGGDPQPSGSPNRERRANRSLGA